MLFDTIPILVYRKVAPDPTQPKWGTAQMQTYAYSHTVYGTVQPFTGDEGNHSNQLFANVRDLITFDDPNVDIVQGDELEYDNEKQRVQFIQRLKNSLIPHAEIYTTETQWQRA
jgi:hypothetical protein